MEWTPLPDRQSASLRVYKDHEMFDGCGYGFGFSGPPEISDDGLAEYRKKESEAYYCSVFKNDHIGNSPIPDELCATIDTGCQRMSIGFETLKKLDAALSSGLRTHLVPQEHRFRSVHGTSTTRFVAVIPTSLGPKGSLLRPAVFSNQESCHEHP